MVTHACLDGNKTLCRSVGGEGPRRGTGVKKEALEGLLQPDGQGTGHAGYRRKIVDGGLFDTL